MRVMTVLAALAIMAVGCARTDSEHTTSDSTRSTMPGGAAMEHGDTAAMAGGMKMSGNMESDMAMMNDMMARELQPADALYDHRFIDMMIPHHEGAIMMARDARQNSNRPELKALAESIITGQQKEIDQMKQWRAAWYGATASNGMAKPEVMMNHMSMMNDMMVKKLGQKDADYEKRFIDMMIPHHEGAVGMAEDARGKAAHPEIKELAQSIIDAQKQEIAQMERWRKDWYGH